MGSVPAVDGGTTDDVTEAEETAEGEEDSRVPPIVQYYIDEGVISYEDAVACGFMSNPENVMLLALFETARQHGLQLELVSVDLQTGTFEFKIKSADERLNGATISLVMSVAGAGAGWVAGGAAAGRARSSSGKDPATEASGSDSMASFYSGATLQVFRSGGEVGEAAIGVDATESQSFAEIFEQDFQAVARELSASRDSSTSIVAGMR